MLMTVACPSSAPCTPCLLGCTLPWLVSCAASYQRVTSIEPHNSPQCEQAGLVQLVLLCGLGNGILKVVK